MDTFKTSLKKIGLHALRCGLFAAGAIVMAVIFVSAWLQRILTPLLPVIVAALPEQYRRVLLLLAGGLPKRTDNLNQKSAG